MGLKTLLNKAGIFLHDNSSGILTILSMIGVGMTVYTAHQDTLKAEDVIYREQPRDNKEMVKMCWKCYIPTGITAASTMLCIGGIQHFNNKQKEALSSAYLLSQTTLQEYQRRVVDRIGVNKERELRDEVLREIADRQALPLYSDGGMVGDVIDTGKGTTIFYDVPGDTHFKSDINYIRSVVNDLNYEVRTEMIFDWNEIRYRWGIPSKRFGSEMIMDVDHPLEVRFEPEMMENGQVRVLLDYDLIPRYGR